LKSSFENFVTFQAGMNENHRVATEEIKKYFDGIRGAIQKKEESIFSKLKEVHTTQDTKMAEEVESLKTRITKMEKEENFVEQLKLKVEAKVEVKRIQDENTKHFADTYLFDFNPSIVTTIDKNLEVKPSDSKLTLGKIKAGAKPKTFSTEKVATTTTPVKK